MLLSSQMGKLRHRPFDAVSHRLSNISSWREIQREKQGQSCFILIRQAEHPSLYLQPNPSLTQEFYEWIVTFSIETETFVQPNPDVPLLNGLIRCFPSIPDFYEARERAQASLTLTEGFFSPSTGCFSCSTAGSPAQGRGVLLSTRAHSIERARDRNGNMP